MQTRRHTDILTCRHTTPCLSHLLKQRAQPSRRCRHADIQTCALGQEKRYFFCPQAYSRADIQTCAGREPAGVPARPFKLYSKIKHARRKLSMREGICAYLSESGRGPTKPEVQTCRHADKSRFCKVLQK